MRAIFLAILLTMCCSVFAQQGKREREIKRLNKTELKDSVFDKGVFNRNFVKVDKNYLTRDFKTVLYKVACYNEIVKLVDSTDLIQPVFTFAGDSIVAIQFKHKNILANIVKDTLQNGIVIFEDSGYEGTEPRLIAGTWKNKRRDGNYYEYRKAKKIFFRATYKDGKELSRTNYSIDW